MTGRGSTRGPDGELDADLERRLRAAFGGASAPEAPETVHAEVSRLVSAPKVRMRARVGGRLSVAFAAVGVGLFVVLVGSLPSIGSGPAPSASGDASASADDSVQPSVPSPSAAGSGACDVSPGTMHGTWWREIGGPNAFFNWGDGARVSQPFPWKLIVRFDPDAASTEEVSVWAERLDSGAREPGAFNSPIDPSTIYSFDTPAPDLSGGWYFFEQPLPTAGCWRLSAAIDGRLAGTSVVEVVEPDAPGTTGSPSIAPTPVVEPTPPPAASMKPAADDVLPLAGRDGRPGMLYCGPYMPFAFDALDGPTGAEDGVGPEFDALRSIALGDPDPGGDLQPDPTFREVARDAKTVLFLHDRPGSGLFNGGRYIYIKVESDGVRWRWAGSGDCHPRAVWPSGYGQATWTLDPAFRAPGPDTRTLHILVQELACAGGHSASGRISPAFVTWDAYELVIELFVETLPGEGDCPAAPSTPATVRLPVPLGDRVLFDAGTIGQGGTSG